MKIDKEAVSKIILKVVKFQKSSISIIENMEPEIRNSIKNKFIAFLLLRV